MQFQVSKGLKVSTKFTAPTNKIGVITGENRARLVSESTDTTKKWGAIDTRWQQPPNPYITRDPDTGEYTWNLGKALFEGQFCFWMNGRAPIMYVAKEEGVYPNNTPKFVWKRVIMNITVLDARTGRSFDNRTELYPP